MRRSEWMKGQTGEGTHSIDANLNIVLNGRVIICCTSVIVPHLYTMSCTHGWAGGQHVARPRPVTIEIQDLQDKSSFNSMQR